MEIFEGTPFDPLFEWTRATSWSERSQIARATLPTLVRLGAGAHVQGACRRPPSELLVLYERETCPRSRLVREAMAMLDLDAWIKPVPSGSTIHAPELLALTGQVNVPVLVDPATGAVIEGAQAILMHLFEHYGHAAIPLRLRLMPTSRLASRLRGGRGQKARVRHVPQRTLELTGYEASPSTRLVREILDELELPYISKQLAASSPRRRAFFESTGSMELPHLFDPNEHIEIVSLGPIMTYLEQTYGSEHASVCSLERARTRALYGRKR